ncbi:uncharacterized protein LOC118357256 [Zalophus californianus]|uniref:Uncharacterized protein LOC118357256 n=1 Tax=Zalophus californianus TaxID=9704 RepID=A0A6P9FF03_ZALCA|nr:uncharacterized protein LOC118357256 [Zalophus californianus]
MPAQEHAKLPAWRSSPAATAGDSAQSHGSLWGRGAGADSHRQGHPQRVCGGCVEAGSRERPSRWQGYCEAETTALGAGGKLGKRSLQCGERTGREAARLQRAAGVRRHLSFSLSQGRGLLSVPLPPGAAQSWPWGHSCEPAWPTTAAIVWWLLPRNVPTFKLKLPDKALGHCFPGGSGDPTVRPLLGIQHLEQVLKTAGSGLSEAAAPAQQPKASSHKTHKDHVRQGQDLVPNSEVHPRGRGVMQSAQTLRVCTWNSLSRGLGGFGSAAQEPHLPSETGRGTAGCEERDSESRLSSNLGAGASISLDPPPPEPSPLSAVGPETPQPGGLMAEHICRQKVLWALGTPCKRRKGLHALNGAQLSSQQAEKALLQNSDLLEISSEPHPSPTSAGPALLLSVASAGSDKW